MGFLALVVWSVTAAMVAGSASAMVATAGSGGATPAGPAAHPAAPTVATSAEPVAESDAGSRAESDAGTSAAPIQGVDSMWVWSARPADELASTVKSLGVQRVFLFVGTSSPEGDSNLRRSVRLLHQKDVAVYALSGEPQWTFQHGAALRWARHALKLAPFDGLHLDVEPHALKNWKRDQQQLIADYLQLLDQVTALPGPLEVDVQFAYGKIATPGGSTFADDILARVDGVTAMTYRDTADGGNGMLAISQDWLQRAQQAGKPVWLGAETNPEPDCPYCTFYEEGQAQMASVLTDVDTTERAAFSTYRGIAIEDLDGWLALGP